MRACLGCGNPLLKRHQISYCSNACQQAARRQRLLAEWLETGLAEPRSERGHFIRDYLAEQQEHMCAVCSQPAIWNGISLILVLDHVDGDSTHNRRENLRLVCPNCDSQLPTYKSRNRGHGRHWRRQRYADGKSF